jgi:hypothetical protein
MKSRVFRTFAFSISWLLITIVPSLALAQWHPDSTENTPVCVTTGQQDQPHGCTDGNNGAIFVWEDARAGVYQIYAQHIGQNGHPRWQTNGVKLATVSVGNPIFTSPIITTDDSGGAYVVWLDSRNTSLNGTCLFAQHVLANGALAYPDSGLPVAIGLNGCTNPTLCDDGFGGAFVAWEDNRSATSSTRPDIWMNHLWSHSVKYGLTTAGPNGMVGSTYNFFTHKTTYFFHDSSAHFKPYMIGLYLNIPTKGSFQISDIIGDTQISLKSYPSSNGPFSYSVANLTGLAIDTIQNKQSGPKICNDGNGGCFLAWTNDATTPNSIYGTHIDSSCNALWDAAPKPGFQLYASSNTLDYSRNVSLNRDGNQLMLAWQVFNTNNNSQEIFAQRIRCNTPTDTTFLWGSANNAVDITSDQNLDQVNAQIFSDDSLVLGVKGALVPFVDQEPSSTDNYDIAMVRVLGDGGNLVPQSGNGFWFYEQKPHMHNNFQAIKITDTSNAGSRTGLMAVWDDAWDGSDTMVYVQRMDRTGRKYFPTAGTSNKWGQVVSGNGGPTHVWTAKQPCIVPRTDGAIVGWTDFRNGTAAIYCQLVLMDGSLWIPSDTTPPTLKLLSSTPPDNDSACNSQCSTFLAYDGGSLRSGIGSIDTMDMNNMQLQEAFTKGADSVTFTVCVIDSFQNGSGSVVVRDTALNYQSVSFNYCTIPDTSDPVITWDTAYNFKNWLFVHIRDNGAWDRGLKSVTISDTANVILSGSGHKLTAGTGDFEDTVTVIDTTKPAQFWIVAADVAGNAITTPYKFNFTPRSLSVQSTPQNSISLSVFPNPVSGTATVMLQGAITANVTVSDVLGRTVDQFRLEGSHQWEANSLSPGTYIIRASIGDVVVCKRIVRE